MTREFVVVDAVREAVPPLMEGRMMEIKCIEIRDHGTCVPAIAIKMIGANPIQARFFERCGYPLNGRLEELGGQRAIVLMRLSDQRATVDPYEWGSNDRTHKVAHNYIYEHFEEIKDGAVIDVRVILGETSECAEPEIWTERMPA